MKRAHGENNNISSRMIWWRRLVQTKILHHRLLFATSTPSLFSCTSYHQMPPKFFNVVNHTETTSMLMNDDPSSTVHIAFDDNELKLFSFLRNVVQTFEESLIGKSLNKANVKDIRDTSLIVRIAGGWVRDKLLGISSDDVDLAINHFTGVQFASLLEEYNTHMALQKGDALEISSMGVVAANPAQSKHLETVCMRISNIDIDICHLRSQEVYKEDSRIPDVEFGSPQDDAERRDFTINSLFYNIHTNQIEDWTGRGWDDIQKGLIVTPLEPRTTFLDDPLRVLRAIRFAVRYNYTLTCKSTIQLGEVRTAFETKVSRERVGKELEGMLSGKKANPVNAIKTIHELGLSSLVFMLPPQTTPLTEDEWMSGLDYACRMPEVVQPLLQDDNPVTTSTTTKPDLRLLPLFSYLLPLRSRTYKVHKKDRPVIEYIVKESLKFNTKDAKAAVTTFEVLDRMLNLLECKDFSNRLVVGLLLRDAKGMWVTALVLAALLRNDTSTTLYVDAYQRIKVLDDCWNTKPLLDGQCLMQELGLTKGPGVGTALQAQIEWMLENPNATKESYLEYLRQQRKRRQAEEVLSK